MVLHARKGPALCFSMNLQTTWRLSRHFCAFESGLAIALSVGVHPPIASDTSMLGKSRFEL